MARIALGLKQRRARIKTALAPVTGLPTETLREIFLIAAANDPTSKLHITISHVSSHWRAASIYTKELWTTICYPAMLHECAERAGDQRLHFTPSSKAYWPHDLELTLEEALRLSTWLLRLSIHHEGGNISGPPERFTSSLTKRTTLIMPDTIIIMGPEYACKVPALGQALSLSTKEQSALRITPRAQLTEVSLSNMLVSECTSFLRILSLHAPCLSRLRLRTIFPDEFSAHDELELIEGAYIIEDPPCHGQLESLTVTGCCAGVCFPVLNWVMPRLVSLTLDLRPTPGQDDWYPDALGTIHNSLEELVRNISPEKPDSYLIA